MGRRLRAAIVGCGRIGTEFDDDPKRGYVATHAGAYSAVSGTELVAVCDRDMEKASRCARRWKVDSVYSDAREMLENEGVDILSICTPPQTHCDIMKEAFKFCVRGIFCEKPIAQDLNQAKRVLNMCSRHRRVPVLVDHQRRFDKLHQEIRDFIRRGRLGRPQQANFYYTAGVKNTGSHMFDMLRFFFGEAAWVKGVFSKNRSRSKGDLNIDGMVKFKNGLLVTFQACDVKKYLVFELNIFFEKGRLILKDSGFEVDLYNVRDSRHFSGYKELYKVKHGFRTNYSRSFMVEGVKHLIECIRTTKAPASSAFDGYKAQELVEKSVSSAKNNAKKALLS